MKKNLKKIAMCLVSTMILQTCCFTASIFGADATIKIDVDWDSQTIGTTFPRGNNKHIEADGTGSLYVNGNTDTTEVVPEGGTATGTAVSVAADPKDSTGVNKVLMIDTDKRTGNSTDAIKVYNYSSKTEGLQVVSAKVMWTASTKTTSWFVKGDSYIYFYPGTDTIEVKDKAKKNTYCTLNYNEWVELKYVFDIKTTDDGTIDVKTSLCTAYVNNQKLFSGTWENLNMSASGDLVVAFNCNGGSGNGALVYIDDYHVYYGSEESELEIENYDALNDAVYISGAELKLNADSYIGTDFGVPFDKVEWYCDDELIGVGESIEYTPSVGEHIICAGGYIYAENESVPCKWSEDLVITVEPEFTEVVLMDEDFENYTDGETKWYEGGVTSKEWNAPKDATSITVDDAHQKSLNSGATKGRSVRADVGISSGTVKISGEYYFNSSTDIYDTTMFVLNNGDRDIYHLSLRGTYLKDGTKGTTTNSVHFEPKVTLVPQRWYKLDLILTFQDGQGYYSIYLDGRRLAKSPYSFGANVGDYTSITSTNKVTFLSAHNTSEVYVDNLKISEISFDRTDFYDGENKISDMSEVESGILTAKTFSGYGEFSNQFMAIYDSGTNRMLNLVQGAFDSTTSQFIAECDISGYGDAYAKVFLWEGLDTLMPLCKSYELSKELSVDNIVTTFYGDGGTTRGFAWTAEMHHKDMAISYAEADEDWDESNTIKEAEYTEYEGKLFYKADISELKPGETYVYKIGDTEDNVWSDFYTFKTEPDDLTEFSFIGVADAQARSGFTYYRDTLDAAFVDAPEASFMVNLGDMIEEGYDYAQWDAYFDSIEGIAESTPHMAVVGNHETRGDRDTAVKYFTLMFNNPQNGEGVLGTLTADSVSSTESQKGVINNIDGTVYSFDYGNVHFAVLNSGSDYGTQSDLNKILREEAKWLKNDLESSDKKWKIVMIHQGMYPAMTGRFETRTVLGEVIDECGVDLVLQGHDHMVARTYPMKADEIVTSDNTASVVKGTGTLYAILGSAGTKRYTALTEEKIPDYMAFLAQTETKKPTYSVFDVNDERISVVTKQSDGVVIDSFEIIDK